MKYIIKNLCAIMAAGGVIFALPLPATAQKFSLKPNVGIGVGNSMTVKSELKDLSKNTNTTDFGVDFGYTFWEHGANRLEANIGLGYSVSSLKFNTPGMNYHYDAPSAADEDGNSYIRYYELSEMSQKVDLGYLTIPVYLSYSYLLTHRIRVHADIGIKFGFNCCSKIKSITGTSYSYGVYPEYDNLLIDASYINDFGVTDLANSRKGSVDANGFYTSLLLGAAVDFNVYGPLWFDVGIRYNYGFINSFKHKFNASNYNSDTAPVTYLAKEGQTVKSLTDYFTSGKLSPLQILIGVTVKF